MPSVDDRKEYSKADCVSGETIAQRNAKARWGWPAGFSNNPAITYSRVRTHYHRPWMLNGRVRNGNGCGHPGKVTGSFLGVSINPCLRVGLVENAAYINWQ